MHTINKRWKLGLLGFGMSLALTAAAAQMEQAESKINDAATTFAWFTANDENAIPADLLQRAYGIAVIPDLFRGGFILGARRGKGILVVRTPDGQWSNPSFITLTGGSIGWQIGAESADIVLVFANENAIRNIESGKFTFSGDASAVAGPADTHNTAAVTFQAEVYAYYQSRGLFAGAALEGARLSIDDKANEAFYGGTGAASPLAPQSVSTPGTARRFLLSVEQATSKPGTPVSTQAEPAGEAVIFPLGDD